MFESISYLNELITMCFIAIFMAVSPGSDFVMVTRNCIFYGRKSGFYSAIGISLAIWIHVAYSIAGLAVLISNSIFLFSILKYLGAAYLIYIGWKTFTSKTIASTSHKEKYQHISSMEAFKMGFLSNMLNPKTTIFFLSVFTQVVTPDTSILVQLIYGLIISLAHLIWFILVSYIFTHSILMKKFDKSKKLIEKLIGTVLIGFGLKVAFVTNI